jgi:hypothetical protein
MKNKLIAILLALVLAILPATNAYAATTQDVTVTWTPTSIALTNSEASWAIGNVVASYEYYWWTADGNAPAPEPFEAADMKSTITNTGNVAEDIDIHNHNSAGGAGWTVSTDETPVADEFSMRAGITGTANRAAMIQVVTGDTELVDNLAASGTKAWCMSLETGTYTVTDNQSCTVTLTASAAN